MHADAGSRDDNNPPAVRSTDVPVFGNLHASCCGRTGSTIRPSRRRRKHWQRWRVPAWRCGGCKTPFARGTTSSCTPPAPRMWRFSIRTTTASASSPGSSPSSRSASCLPVPHSHHFSMFHNCPNPEPWSTTSALSFESGSQLIPSLGSTLPGSSKFEQYPRVMKCGVLAALTPRDFDTSKQQQRKVSTACDRRWCAVRRLWTRRWRWLALCSQTRSAAGCCACTSYDWPAFLCYL